MRRVYMDKNNVFLSVFLPCFLRKQYNDVIMVIADDMVMEARLR